MRVSRRSSHYIAQFPALAEFELSGRTITCRPRAGVPLITLRHLLLDQFLPAVLGARGQFVLHASAVKIGGCVVAFAGAAGAGKSTLAAALARAGAHTVTDDALVVQAGAGRLLVAPTYPGLRLWPDAAGLLGRWNGVNRRRVAHYASKQRWTSRSLNHASAAAPLAAIYFLRRGTRAAVRPMPLPTAMMSLVRYSMMLDPTDRRAAANGFRMASRLVDAVCVRRLIVPAGARGLRRAAALLLDANR